jgi:2-polyprenyl-6-hydroxyphenyl methylase/3-demethylubiquinone-9 3-methyltransferase
MPVSSASIDHTEVERFNRIGDDWWDREGPMRALHRMNPTRVSWIRQRASGHFPQAGRGLHGLRVLDIGCGGGLLAESLARLGADVMAIDPAPDNIEIARGHARVSRLTIDYRSITGEDLAATGASFDIVCAMEVIEHVVAPRDFVAMALSLTRPGGLFFAATINRTLKSFGLAILGAEYVMKWVPKGTHQWEKFIKPDELEDAIEAGGGEVIERAGVVYTPLGDTWRVSRDLGVNYMMAAVRDA